jgi:hypothetical protein
MRQPQGYAVLVDPKRGVSEWDTFTCFHCQKIVQVAARVDPSDLGGFCLMCMKHICGPCAGAGVCRPFEKRLEEYERKSRLHRAVGTVLASFLLLLWLSSNSYGAELYLAWSDASSDETSFEIERATSLGGTYSNIATVAANVTTYRDINLVAGQEYCYRIRSCISTCSDYTTPVCQRPTQLPGSNEFQ